MTPYAIELEHIGKLYRLGQVGTGTLSQDLNRWWQTTVRGKDDPYLKIGARNDRRSTDRTGFVWSLQDINLKIEEGDVVGFIGKNGAGKSTLLKILSRITTPSTGVARVYGSLSSLLEVGTGFHWELTGRENIYMNGTILGMKEREIRERFDDIVDFAGISKYIDTPTKRYSSGMLVRLGFAVAAFLNPDILVVDEVLAVGDAEFQKMAIGKMQDISQHGGRTVLFVSHNMGMMQQLCNHGVLLEDGCMKFTGTIGDTIAEYQRTIMQQTRFEGIDGREDTLYLKSAKVSSENGDVFYNTHPIQIEMTVVIKQANLHRLIIGFNLYSKFNSPLARADYNDVSHDTTLAPGEYRFVFEIPAYTLSDGEYRVHFEVYAKELPRRATTEVSNLTFTIMKDETGFGNAYNERSQIKTSIIRGNWLKEV